MDVRCDRCQTEYELDDESVADGGASVQCTSCGNTFVVGRQRRPETAPPAAQTAKPAPAGSTTSSWMLTTEEGKTHRFRDSTTLQKWVVERRVGRMDRVCPPNGTWRRLGDVDELRPFFDVVDQADRAAAAARVARPTRPETPRGSLQGRSTYVSADADDDDILTSRPPRQSAVGASFAGLSPEEELAAAGLGPRHG
ncbi:MAG TPA: zinc-ribbon domain-containing protein, partial [Polyangia bacterium]|nr:zinc-ribbon domain-containing protein [Polyangia bacterium]